MEGKERISERNQEISRNSLASDEGIDFGSYSICNGKTTERG